MKRFRVLTAALCAAVLLCGFSVPAYAYAGGGEGEDYGDPKMCIRDRPYPDQGADGTGRKGGREGKCRPNRPGKEKGGPG